ncbi:hypothetical protein EDB80DRAFT_23394 [Ilyonectria destructans]|nr:hypothetical protein EDB80DRAFT_23394 [Ilyonectria destructans]
MFQQQAVMCLGLFWLSPPSQHTYVGDIACHVLLVWQLLLLLLTTHDRGWTRQIMSGLVSWLRLTKLGASLCAWYITWAILRRARQRFLHLLTTWSRRRCSRRRMPPRLVRARTSTRAPFKPGTWMPRYSFSKRAADETLAWCSSRRWQPCHARGCGL